MGLGRVCVVRRVSVCTVLVWMWGVAVGGFFAAKVQKTKWMNVGVCVCVCVEEVVGVRLSAKRIRWSSPLLPNPASPFPSCAPQSSPFSHFNFFPHFVKAFSLALILLLPLLLHACTCPDWKRSRFNPICATNKTNLCSKLKFLSFFLV